MSKAARAGPSLLPGWEPQLAVATCPSGWCCLFLSSRLWPRWRVGELPVRMRCRGIQVACLLWMCVLPCLRGRGPSRAEVRQGPWPRAPWLPRLPHPSRVQAVFPGLHSASWVFPPLPCSGPSMDRYLGTSPHSSQRGIWGWSGQAGMRGQRAEEKGAKEEALSQASLFSSPTGPGHGPVSGCSPGTGALTPEVPLPQGTTGRFNQGWGGHEHVGRGGSWRELRETLGDRSGGDPTKAMWTTRGLPCPPRMRGLQGLAVKVPVTSSS